MAQYKTFSTMAGGDGVSSERIVPIPHITSPHDRYQLIQSNKIVVIDNFADWCGPCKHCVPKFAKLSQQYRKDGLCAFAQENVDDSFDGIPAEIQAVPCFHFYVDGVFQNELTVMGADISAVENNLKKLLN
jgi:thioredoxin 1